MPFKGHCLSIRTLTSHKTSERGRTYMSVRLFCLASRPGTITDVRVQYVDKPHANYEGFLFTRAFSGAQVVRVGSLAVSARSPPCLPLQHPTLG